jgi:hypothetical protein
MVEITPIAAAHNVKRRPQVCPQCQRPFAPRLFVHGPVRQRIVDIVSNRPDGITRRELLDLVYACDPGGGPSNENVVSVIIKSANAELAHYGYRIASMWRGRGAKYRLLKMGSDR